ncbi:MAG: UPF0182 family protein [Clostridia bacterium]|jgi:uncharacterized membrane protein (UPF0182 family)|nr:UPF0182 family protein [Clostridia bacterium]
MEEETKLQLQAPKKKKRKGIVLIFFILAILVTYVIYRGEYLETLELGEKYLSIYWQNLSYQVLTFGVNFVILYFLIYLTNKRIKKGLRPFFEEEKKQIPKMLNKSIAFIGAIIVSFFVTNTMLEKLLLCVNATSFGLTDPILGYDIGYFIFGQPFVQFVLRYIFMLVVGLTIYAALYYIIAFNSYFDGINRETLKQSKILKQLCTNIMIIAILLAGVIFTETLNVGIQKFMTLPGNEGEAAYSLWGAGISEVTINLWGYRILAVVVLISILMAVHYFKKGVTKKVLISLATVPSYLVIMMVILIGFEAIFVNPNELDKQQEYIKANINATKQAYGINIEEVNVGENETVTKKELQENEIVANNIVIAGPDIVLKNLNILQTNKGYYTYRTTKIASYLVDGKQSLVYISPREITNSAGTYNNKTYQYTHGYGVVITSATTVDNKGDLVHLQKGFEENENEVVKVQEPRIYFGLETNDTVVTNSKAKAEFDYPITSSTKAENAENVYEGKAGLKLNFLDRFILAMREKDFKLAFSGNVNSESKILINRNIIQRAKTLMPHILYDEDPYLVVTKEGRLVWVLDGYTTSNYYPYSQRTTLQKDSLLNKLDLNYIRNSVKVLIDAYDGTVEYYITDRNDPIIMAYQKIYKDLFVEKDITISEDISSQFVYPKFLYNIQAQVMERYHNIQTDVLYRGDDIWKVATHNNTKVATKTGTPIESYYAMVKTIDKEEPTLGLIIPYTPYQKQNITAYLIGRYEEGKANLTLYKYPTDSNVLGPMQIDTQLEQDETIAKEIEDLNVTGTKLIKDMIVIPMNHSLLYIEPIYRQYMNEENTAPTLKKVVVASGNKVAIGNNLKEALDNLVSQYAVDIEVESTDSIEEIITAILKTNNNLKQSSENGNWEMYGRDMAKLQELLAKLEKLMKEKEKEKNNQQGLNNNHVNNIVVNTTDNTIN